MSVSNNNIPYISGLFSTLTNNHPSSTVENKYQTESATKQEENREDVLIANLVTYSTDLRSQYEASLQKATDRILILENAVTNTTDGIDKANNRITRSKAKVIRNVWGAALTIIGVIGTTYIFVDGKITTNSEKIVSSENRIKDKMDEHILTSSSIQLSHAESISKLNSDVGTLDARKEVFEKLVPKVASNSTGIQHISDRLNIKSIAVKVK